MKRALLLLALIFLLGGSVWYFFPRENATLLPEPPPAVMAPPAAPTRGAVATAALGEEALAKEPSHPMAVRFGNDPALAAKEPALLLEILEFYRKEFGAFPAGQENADIMRALTGNNPRRLSIFPRKHPRMDASGNLLDAWGKPFVFHPISSQHLEVRSCGPDGDIFTADDIRVPAPR